MNHKKIQEKNINELETTTSTDLQADVGKTDTSLYNNKHNNIELIEYKLEELSKKINEIEKSIKEINMPLIDKINNKYKTVFSWGAGIVTTIVTVIVTVSVVLFRLYDDSIQTHFSNIEEKISELFKYENELKTDIKEISQKQNSLEIKIVENKKK